MLTRLFWSLVGMTALLLAFSGYAHLRARALSDDAAALTAETDKASAEYAKGLDTASQDRDITLLDRRRGLLLSASAWSRGMLAGLGGAVLSLFAAWVMRELKAIHTSLDLDEPAAGSVEPKA